MKTADKHNIKAEQAETLVKVLLEISGLVGSTQPLNAILDQIVTITADLMQMPICSIYLIEQDGVLRKRSNVGLREKLSRQATFRLGQGVPGWVALHGEMVALSDLTKDARYASHPVVIKKPHAYICVPLRVNDRVIGVLSARQMEVKEFTGNQCRLFQTVADMIAIVINKHQTEQEKKQAQHLAAVATSLSEVAHYIKNVMFTTLVAEKTINNAFERIPELSPFRTSWRNLRRSNQKIHKLVEDMLNYYRERAEHFELSDINEIVGNAIRDLRDHAAKHGTELADEPDPSIGPVSIDRDAMYDVLLNLISNGIDAVPEGRKGKVVVRTRNAAKEKKYAIEVEDNGSGIPEEVQERMFSLFFSTKGDKGTGIGLAATRKVVEQHGGTVEFETKPGKGTCFTVSMPRLPSEALVKTDQGGKPTPSVA